MSLLVLRYIHGARARARFHAYNARMRERLRVREACVLLSPQDLLTSRQVTMAMNGVHRTKRCVSRILIAVCQMRCVAGPLQ